MSFEFLLAQLHGVITILFRFRPDPCSTRMADNNFEFDINWLEMDLLDTDTTSKSGAANFDMDFSAGMEYDLVLKSNSRLAGEKFGGNGTAELFSMDFDLNLGDYRGDNYDNF